MYNIWMYLITNVIIIYPMHFFDMPFFLYQSRREGHVPGPITRAKMEAYESKHSMAEVLKVCILNAPNRSEVT